MGQRVFIEPSNDPPYYSDATTDADGLLTNNSSKRVVPKIPTAANNGADFTNILEPGVDTESPSYSPNGLLRRAIASEVTIINASSKDATVQVVTAPSHNSLKAAQQKGIAMPILAGETLTIKALISEIIEKNVGGATQTGRGLRYYFTIAPIK